MSTTKTTVYLDAADYRRLKAAAERRGTSVAQLVREAVSEYVRKTEGDRPRPRSVGTGRSGRGDLSERAEDLLGEELLRRHGRRKRAPEDQTEGDVAGHPGDPQREPSG